MFKVQIDVETLEECVAAIVGVVDEGVLNIAIDRLDVRAVDPANVAMIDLKIPCGGFIDYEFAPPTAEGKITSTEIKIGVDFANLLGLLKLWERKNVKLELDEEANELHIKSECFDYSYSLIDPSSLRKIPKNPQITYPNQMDIAAERFINAIHVLERVDDNVSIGVKDEELCMWAEEDRGTLNIALGEVANMKGSRSLYSLDYLSAMCKAIPVDMPTDTVTLFWGGSDYPLQINFNIAYGRGKVSYFLAPRLLPDD